MFAVRKALLAVVTLATAAVPCVGWSAQKFVFYKAGVGADRTLADQAACAERASHEQAAHNYIVPSSGGMSPLAAGIASAILDAQDQTKLEHRLTARCMRDRSYVPLPLTEAEAAAQKSAKSDDARRVWLNTFLTQDMTARLNAQRPVVPLFEDLPPQPYSVAGVVLDPATFKLDGASLTYKTPFLTGKASHQKTGVLTDDFRAPISPPVAFVKGTVMHQIPNPDPDLYAGTLWCGESRQSSLTGTHRGPLCLGAYQGGYRVCALGPARAWLVGQVGPAAPYCFKPTGGRLNVDVSPSDLVGPMDFQLRLADVYDKAVVLEASALRDGKKVVFWRGRFPLDAKGQTVVPFWRDRLLITADGVNQSAVLTHDGAGTGLDEVTPGA